MHRLLLVGGSTVLLEEDHYWTLSDSGLIRVWDDFMENRLIAAYGPGQWRTLEAVEAR